MAYLGDSANNMANSYLLGGARRACTSASARPESYLPTPPIVAARRGACRGDRRLGARHRRPADALSGADVVATDTWVSMGQEDERERVPARRPVPRLRRGRRSHGARGADAIVLHCLPAYRGYEIAADVIDGPQSVVWDEAETGCTPRRRCCPSCWQQP